MPVEVPELWNLTRPDDVRAVHEAYFAAGADAIYANTFGANAAKYHGDAPLADVIAAGIGIARSTPGSPLVALDVGPTGRLLKPAGDFEFDAAYDAFAEQVAVGAKAGADLVVVETMGDTCELKAAVLAAKENSDLPILATVALGENGKLLTGGDVGRVDGAHVVGPREVPQLGHFARLKPARLELRPHAAVEEAYALPRPSGEIYHPLCHGRQRLYHMPPRAARARCGIIAS